MRCSVLVALVLASSPASAVTFQYVGAVPLINRTGIPINTGTLTIDPAKLEGGTLANARLTYQGWREDGPGAADPIDGVDIAFTAFDALRDETEILAFDLQFDADANLASWEIESVDVRSFSRFGHTFRTFSAAVVPNGTGYSVPFYEDIQYWDVEGGQWISYQALLDRGYTAEHPDYDALLCGSWAGETCGESGGPSAAWTAKLLATSPGQWFKDDPLGFARQLAFNGELASLNPPRSYDDIPQATPVPLPAGLPLMLGGIAFFALLRRRRSASSSLPVARTST